MGRRFIFYDLSSEMRIIGKDIINPQEPDSPMVKIAVGRIEDDNASKEIMKTMYKTIADNIRNGVLRGVVTLRSDGSVDFHVTLPDGKRIPKISAKAGKSVQ